MLLPKTPGTTTLEIQSQSQESKPVHLYEYHAHAGWQLPQVHLMEGSEAQVGELSKVTQRGAGVKAQQGRGRQWGRLISQVPLGPGLSAFRGVAVGTQLQVYQAGG